VSGSTSSGGLAVERERDHRVPSRQRDVSRTRRALPHENVAELCQALVTRCGRRRYGCTFPPAAPHVLFGSRKKIRSSHARHVRRCPGCSVLEVHGHPLRGEIWQLVDPGKPGRLQCARGVRPVEARSSLTPACPPLEKKRNRVQPTLLFPSTLFSNLFPSPVTPLPLAALLSFRKFLISPSSSSPRPARHPPTPTPTLPPPPPPLSPFPLVYSSTKLFFLSPIDSNTLPFSSSPSSPGHAAQTAQSPVGGGIIAWHPPVRHDGGLGTEISP